MRRVKRTDEVLFSLVVNRIFNTNPRIILSEDRRGNTDMLDAAM